MNIKITNRQMQENNNKSNGEQGSDEGNDEIVPDPAIKKNPLGPDTAGRVLLAEERLEDVKLRMKKAGRPYSAALMKECQAAQVR